jgi:hypothetical protein
VEPAPVVAGFNVSKELPPDSILGPLVTLLQGLAFERAPKGLHRSIVVTIAFPAHAGSQPVLLELPAVLSTGALHSAVGMMNNPVGLPALEERSCQGLQRPAGGQALLDRPA